MGHIVSPNVAETIAEWDWVSINTKRKDKLLVEMSKMWEEVDFVKNNIWEKEAGGQIHAKLDNLYHITSSASAHQSMWEHVGGARSPGASLPPDSCPSLADLIYLMGHIHTNEANAHNKEDKHTPCSQSCPSQG